MKKINILVMALAAVLLAACGNDDEPKPSQKQQPTSVKAAYQVNVSQDMLEAATVTVYYIDADGSQAHEDITTTSWTKTVTIGNLPTKAGVSVYPTINSEPVKDSYSIEISGKMNLTILDKNGSSIGQTIGGQGFSLQGIVDGEQIERYIARIGGHLYEAKAITADGSVTDTAIEWPYDAE